MSRVMRLMTMGALAVLLVASVGCKAKPVEKPEPTVAPPAVKTAGTLVVGVDLSTPPFAGTENDKQAGIDVDVAAALAEKLGLTVAYRDVKPSDAATALAQGIADVVLSVPYTGSGLTDLALSGTYVTDGPAFFIATEGTASIEPSLTIDTISAETIGAQRGSTAYWVLLDMLGVESVREYETLREALDALNDGAVEAVAGDALVGAYIARDNPAVRIAGQVAPAVPLAAATAPDNAVLSEAVREALDQLAADGILAFIREKWVGDMPELSVEETAAPLPAP